MIASEYKRTEAFCCLMKVLKDRKNNSLFKVEGARKNPLFKVLSLKANDVLEVSCS